MKKLLLLGGLRYLIPVIKTAKKMGHYVITCDYVPDNVAHQYADEYHNVSIIDKEAVLQLAKKLEVDGVMSFAVDPGVLTAAFVCHQLGLPTPGPLKSVKILQNKALFRDFLAKNKFNVPFAFSFSTPQEAVRKITSQYLPVIVKPVDSAGSKGVTRVSSLNELKSATEYALSFSSSKRIIVEEYIESEGFSSDSDSFSIDGNLQLVTFSAQRFDKASPNPYTPSAYSWPSTISKSNQKLLKNELQRLISLLKMNSSIYNIEVREGENGKAYIMEVSPRAGGNRLSEMINNATGVNLIKRSIQAALGEKIEALPTLSYKGYWAEVILYSNTSGFFESVEINEAIKEEVFELDLWVGKGDAINAFSAANDAIGTLVLKFDSQKRLEFVLKKYTDFLTIKLQK